MKIRLILIALAFAAVPAPPASAAFADQRSFFHPLGFWGNDYFVAQRQIYPRFFYAPRDPAMESSGDGGWILHERNR